MLATLHAQERTMLQNQHFIHSLIELRDRYHIIVQECTSAISHATEQLNRIHALLVDQLVEQQQLTESLLQLRAHYQTQHAQQHSKAQSAKEQIAHINALLADQLILQHNELQIIQSAPDTPIRGETSRTEVSSTVEPKHLDISRDSEVSSPTLVDEVLTQLLHESEQQPSQQVPEHSEQSVTANFLQKEVVGSAFNRQQDEQQHSESDSPIQFPDPEHSTFLEYPQQLPSPKLHKAQSQFLKTPLLPQYQHLSKSEAVEQLLQENEGSILHLDYIVRAVQGEVEQENLKAERLRMNDTLRKGVEKGLWEKVPDSPGCYTIDLKLIASNSENQDSKSRQQKQITKSNEQLLARYQNMSFTAAVTTIVEENVGEVLTPEKVARALYGEIEGKALTKAKAQVGKILWNGAKQGRWKSVPGQLGAYTLQLSTLK
ncbi:hypothetical protein [Chroococcidiopsis sp. TS-821]|uniref:hypothetical protein n=2 Tax=Cyanobacteriota TaxID=1117 RepID=UPI0002A6624C|nr:hypothetical protein Glo7428_5124 [Gloeocapsa sp. PCC 7428]PPS42015.1 hypothetical protein B1A85_16250 [Chroococcidiopsis sp. TS-821]